MRRLAIITAVALGALAAFFAWGYWVYEGQWGSSGDGDGEFSSPSGIAVAPNGNVYVTDNFNDRVQYFTAQGSFLGAWGSEGSADGHLDGPVGIAVAPNGNVYVGEEYNHRVQYFTATGSFLGKWKASAELEAWLYAGYYYPEGVAVAPNGNVYITDSRKERVLYFTPTGSFLGEWGSWGDGDGEFFDPCGIAVAPNGDVYVADSYNDRIQRFTASGSFLAKRGVSGEAPGKFNAPNDVAVGPDGTVYVCDSHNYRVQCFDSSGSFLGQWGKFGFLDEKGFLGPVSVAVSPDGARVYVVDDTACRVQYFKRK
jgi:tripartite motif-containing protein 71